MPSGFTPYMPRLDGPPATAALLHNTDVSRTRHKETVNPDTVRLDVHHNRENRAGTSWLSWAAAWCPFKTAAKPPMPPASKAELVDLPDLPLATILQALGSHDQARCCMAAPFMWRVARDCPNLTMHQQGIDAALRRVPDEGFDAVYPSLLPYRAAWPYIDKIVVRWPEWRLADFRPISGLFAFLEVHAPNLRTVLFHDHGIGSPSLENFVSLHTLALRLNHSYADWAYLASLPNLRALELDDLGPTDCSRLFGVHGLTRLTHLSLRVRSDEIPELHLPELRLLTLEGWHIGDLPSFAALKELRCLRLYLPNLWDLPPLPAEPRLETLLLYDCASLEALPAELLRCPLRHLSIVGCDDLDIPEFLATLSARGVDLAELSWPTKTDFDWRRHPGDDNARCCNSY